MHRHFFRIAIFNLAIIILFALVYYSAPVNSFSLTRANKSPRFIDFIYLSTTIQSTVGLPDIVALTDMAKVCVIGQQVCMMFAIIIVVLYIRLFV